MAASVTTRSHWTDDDGSGTTGTIINEAELQKIYDNIDLLISGTGSYATLDFGGNVLADGTVAATGGLKGRIKSFNEDLSAIAFSATPTFDLSVANNFELDPLTGNVTAITVSNWTASKSQTALIEFTQDGTGGRTVAFPVGWRWDNGVVPTMPTGISKKMIVILYSRDGGATILASTFVYNA